MIIIKKLISILAWLQIAAAPSIPGFLIGFAVFKIYLRTTGIIVGISISVLGLIYGIILAEKVRRKKGTIDFISRISATPELTKDD